MIGVKLQGRLGNQMFQYAFAYVTSQQRNEPFFISARSSKFQLDFFTLNGLEFNSFRNKLSRLFFRLTNKTKTLYQTGSEDTAGILKQIPVCNEFDGYFQSELYFTGFETPVRKLFELKAKHKTDFKKKYGEFFRNNKTMVVHIRRTDYLNWDRGDKFHTNSALPFTYVENFLQKFDTTAYKVLFISDDLAAVKNHFGERTNFHFESNSAIVDLQLLINADVLCLSNSSFSWWGAYLNTKSDKQVFAPDYWLGSKAKEEFPKDIICKDWHKLKTS